MPADYAKIRYENIARYGCDTAVLDLLGQLYSERTHFIFELIQNAEDAGATALAFELFADRLEVRHDGRPFTEADVRGVCGVGKSEKAGDLTQIDLPNPRKSGLVEAMNVLDGVEGIRVAPRHLADELGQGGAGHGAGSRRDAVRFWVVEGRHTQYS